jgi:hydrogenase expression/formation protein HypC
MQLVSRGEYQGTAELRGVQREVSLMLCPEASVGGYGLVHAGYAIATVDDEEAQRTLALLDELAGEGPSE